MRAFRLLPAVLLLAAGCAAPPAAPPLETETPVTQARANALAKAGVLLPRTRAATGHGAADPLLAKAVQRVKAVKTP